MKSVSLAAVMFAALCSSAPAFAATVEARFENLGSAPMTVSQAKSCGVITPQPTTVNTGKTSVSSSVDCGGDVSVMYVTYNMGTKDCTFNISTIYTDSSPLIPGSVGYWTPRVTVQGSRNATCKVVSQDISQITTTGQFSAVFSMK